MTDTVDTAQDRSGSDSGTAPVGRGCGSGTQTVNSRDGTPIAFDRHVGGDAGMVILIGGAFTHRAFPKLVQLAEALARHGLTVVNYDRRGRGDSGDTPGIYHVDGEIDDIAALIGAVGGSASLFGWSSGAGLALRAAASGRIAGIARVVAFEPPFIVDREHHVPPAGLGERLRGLVAADHRAETVRLYMTEAMGIPRAFVGAMRVLPIWSKLKATANSTPHDWAVMGAFMRGERLSRSDWSGVTVPTLVLAGGKSEPMLRRAARAITDVLPVAEHRELPKLSHNPNVKILATAAAEFLTQQTRPKAGSVEPSHLADRAEPNRHHRRPPVGFTNRRKT